MTQDKKNQIEKLGEFGLIDHLAEKVKIHHPSTIKGIGDDGAIIENTAEVHAVSTDMLIEGIHFDLAYHPLKHLGYKAVVVNLSDIYAMNVQPRHITVSMGLSNRFSVEAVDELYAGIYTACEAYQVDLIGGDTTSSLKGLILSVTAMGQGSKSQIVYRNQAKVGDLICVSGDLGGAYLGLQLLEREKRIFMENPKIQPELSQHEYPVGRILKPEARKDIISQLQHKSIQPHAMIDISDGLASELFHLCEQSNVGAYIEEEHIPIAKESETLAFEFGIDPLTAALNGGEDYELLFTLPASHHSAIMQMPDVNIIGEIVSKDKGICLHGKNGKVHPLKAQGWKHF